MLFADTVLLTVTWELGLPQGHASELYIILVGTMMQLCPCQNQSPLTALSLLVPSAVTLSWATEITLIFSTFRILDGH